MSARVAIAVMLVLSLQACTDRMYEQDRPDPTRGPVAFAGTRLRRADGAVPMAPPADEAPPAMSRELLQEGRTGYDAWCTPCHDAAGTGGGIVVQRGFPRPESLHTDAQRALADRDVFRAISEGKGRMAGFADVASPHERWAVTAWVHVLQQSQRTAFAELSPEQRRVLDQSGGPR